MPRTHWFRPLLIGVLLPACVDERLPTQAVSTGVTAPRSAATVDGQGPSLIRDLTFLQPLLQRPEPRFRFDGSLLEDLAVEVCARTDGGCGAVVAHFTSQSPDPERLRLAQENPVHYHANWQTGRSALREGEFYRIRVLLAGREVGGLEVQAVRGGTGGDAAVQIGSTLPLRFHVSRERLAGDPSAPVAGAIPRLDFVARARDYTPDHPTLPGLPLSYNTLLLTLRLGSTVGEANALLDESDAVVVGSLPGRVGGTAGILFLRVPGTTHAQMIALLERLRADERVATAVQDVLLKPQVVSAPNGGTPGGWTWDASPAGGNWGLEVVRAPQMWNLNEAIGKRFVPGLLTGVLDVGFEDEDRHEDIDYLLNHTPGQRDEHGTHVAGIIGATFGNGKGVDGINPFARLVVRAAQTESTGSDAVEQAASWADGLMDELERLIRSDSELRVINVSMGYPWDETTVNTTTNPDAQRLASDQGAIFRDMLRSVVADGIQLPVIVAAAGNESSGAAGRQLAVFGSPLNSAAIEHKVANIIVVEADSLTAAGAVVRSDFSNVAGHLSAPGSGISSLGTLPRPYRVMSGTSMATPHVAGLVGYLYRLDPDLERPTLTRNPMLELLQAYAVPVFGARPRIDAFASVMAVDSVRGNDRVLRMLLDIDDGTPDGNRRVNDDGSDYTQQDADGDGGPGDGRIDMSDFRRWRDWAVQLHFPEMEFLDGGERHPKKDLNGSDIVEVAAQENVYPRGDFNGDGRLEIADTARRQVPGALRGRGELTDLQVLQALFEDAHFAKEDLPELILSGDLEIRAARCLAAQGVASVRSSLWKKGTQEALGTRTHQASDPAHIYTAPVDSTTVFVTEYTAQVEALDGGGDVITTVESDFALAPGSDDVWEPECPVERLGWVLPLRNRNLPDITARAQSGDVHGSITDVVRIEPLEFQTFVGSVTAQRSGNERHVFVSSSGSAQLERTFVWNDAGTFLRTITVEGTADASVVAGADRIPGSAPALALGHAPVDLDFQVRDGTVTFELRGTCSATGGSAEVGRTFFDAHISLNEPPFTTILAVSSRHDRSLCSGEFVRTGQLPPGGYRLFIRGIAVSEVPSERAPDSQATIPPGSVRFDVRVSFR